MTASSARRRRVVEGLGASLAVAFVAFGTPASAVVTTSCNSLSTYDPRGPDGPTSDSDDTTGSCTSSIVAEFAALNSDGEASVGALRARSEATLLEGPTPFQKPLDDAYSFTTVRFQDMITVSSPGLASEIALVRGSVFLEGVVDVVGVGATTVRLMVGGSDLLFEECGSFLGIPCFGSTDPYPRFVSGFFDVSFTVPLGQATSFGLTLLTQARHGGALTNEAGAALADFGGGGELSWQGIESVEHEGSPIPYTVSSESGTDWTQPVPEADAGAAGLAGAVALAATARRRRRRTP